MIEVKGLGGESLVYDGVTLAKWRHDGKEESARNPATTFRQAQVKQRTKLFGRPVEPPVWDVTIACATIFSLSVDASARAAVDELIAALERLQS